MTLMFPNEEIILVSGGCRKLHEQYAMYRLVSCVGVEYLTCKSVSACGTIHTVFSVAASAVIDICAAFRADTTPGGNTSLKRGQAVAL